MSSRSPARSRFHEFQLPAGPALLPAGELCQALAVVGLIRIQSSDWALLPPAGTPFWHFNLGPTPHEVGDAFALVRILRPGLRDGPLQKLPLLAPEGLKRAKVLRCVHAHEVPRVERLHPTPVLLQQVSEEGLLEELGQRYGRTAEELEFELAEAGVTSTLLVIEHELPFPFHLQSP